MDELDVIDLLVAVDKSMVQRDRTGRDRFMMLETLRQFGEERLHATGEAAAARNRHSRFFRNLAVDLDPGTFGPDEAAVWARFDAEWDNLRVPVSYARDGATSKPRPTWYWPATTTGSWPCATKSATGSRALGR